MHDSAGSGQDTSLPGSFRRLGADVLTVLSQRIELTALEMRIAQRRAVFTAAAGMAAAFVLLIALVLFTGAFVLRMWPDDVVTALLVAGGVYVVIGSILGICAFAGFRSRRLPMEALLDVLKEDKEWIIGRQPD